jgi:homoserine O-acetyltransferase
MVQRIFLNFFFCDYFLLFSSGPSSINPETNKPYGSSFPMISVEDFVRAQFQLVKYLGIEKV